MKLYYTIYKTTNLLNNKIYIGCHITKNVNDDYLGSGTNLKKDIKQVGRQNFTKEILFIYDNKEAMIQKEKELVDNLFIARTDTYNIINGGGFITNNCVVVRDQNNNIFMTHVTDPRYLSGELVSCNIGLITVKDQNRNVITVTKDDPRYLSGELVSINKDTKIVIDKTGKRRRVHKDDPGILNGELILIKKSTKIVKKETHKIYLDFQRNIYKIELNKIKTDPRILSGELFKRKKNYVIVKDENDNLFYIPNTDHRINNGELKKYVQIKSTR